MEKFFFLACPGAGPEAIDRPRLRIPAAAGAWAGEETGKILPRGAAYAILHPGTSAFGAFKRWPAERFGRLAARLRAETGLIPLITWGPGEQDLADRAAQASGGSAVISPRTRTIQDLAALIAGGSLFVAADSGPLHIANCLGVPCVALFGPKDPALYGPYFQPSVTVRRDIDCSPCGRRSCPDPVCMTGLEVDTVLKAALDLLSACAGGNRAPPGPAPDAGAPRGGISAPPPGEGAPPGPRDRPGD